MQPSLAALRTFLHLALPYFRSEERWTARGLLAGVVIAEFGVVYALVAFDEWNAYFFNAIEARNRRATLISIGRPAVLTEVHPQLIELNGFSPARADAAAV